MALAYNNRGLSKIAFENYSQAILDFNQAIKFKPTDAGKYLGLGLAHAGLQDYKKAIENCNKAIKLNSNFAAFYELRGYCYQEFGKKTDAEKDFAKAKELGYKE